MDSARSFSRKRTRILLQDSKSKSNTDSITSLAVSGINNIHSGQRTPQSAAERMLSIPELALLVFKQVSPRTWLTLRLLSRTCDEIVRPHIWRTVSCTTIYIFRKIWPHIRRNAHYVETLNIKSLPEPCAPNLLREISHLQTLPNISSLSIPHIKISLDYLSAILAKMPQLKKIDIRGCILPKHALEVLAPCKNIESMAFSHGYVLLSPEYDLNDIFSPWKRLRRLSIAIYPNIGRTSSVKQLEKAMIKSHLDLESLELGTPRWQARIVADIIVRNPNLKRLIWNNCALPEHHWVRVLPSLANLQSMTFHNTGKHSFEGYLAVILELPSIRHIDLRGFTIEGQDFMDLARTTNTLTSLTLNNCHFESCELRPILDNCTRLERLQVDELKGSLVIMELFQGRPWACSNLQELIFYDIVWASNERSKRIVAGSLKAMWTTLKGLSRLRVLTLKHSQRIDPVGLGIHWVGAPSSLEKLHLTGHGSWVQQDVEWIATHLPRLVELECHNKRMTTTLQSWLKRNRPDVRIIAKS